MSPAGTTRRLTELLPSAAALDSITLSPSSPTVATGADQQILATGHYSDGTTANLTLTATWASTDTSKATVSSTGLVHGVAAGTTTITATTGGVTGSTTVTVSAPVPVTLTSILVTPATPTVTEGDEIPMTAIGTYSDGHTADITLSSTWVSSDPVTLAILTPGVGFAGDAGTVTVTVTNGTVTGSTSVTVILATVPDQPHGRFLVAFDANTLDWDGLVWTRLDDAHPNLVTSYTIDRGRQYELDRTDTGRATVTITDTDGILNPRNPASPYHGKIQPLLQAMIGRRNPVTGEWTTRFRGYIEDFNYSFDPSQKVNRLTVSLVDQFEILAAIEMQPGQFGSGTDADGQLKFDVAQVNARIKKALADSGIQPHAKVVFSGNVTLQQQAYSAGESPMTVIQEAADGEFPGVSNVFCDRFGRLCFHGRYAKFNPDAVAAGASIGAWDFQRWKVGDGAACNASPADTAQVRGFGFNRGLAKIINHATATPNNIADADVAAQTVTDTPSVTRYGIRSWSATNLVTRTSLIDGSDAKTETKRFATFYVQNFAQPRDRIFDVSIRSIQPADPRAGAVWQLLGQLDISDAVLVTVASPGGGGFEAESYFVEGVHEQCQPLGDPDYDDITVTLDLSPEAYYASNPWPVPS